MSLASDLILSFDKKLSCKKHCEALLENNVFEFGSLEYFIAYKSYLKTKKAFKKTFKEMKKIQDESDSFDLHHALMELLSQGMWGDNLEPLDDEWGYVQWNQASEKLKKEYLKFTLNRNCPYENAVKRMDKDLRKVAKNDI